MSRSYVIGILESLRRKERTADDLFGELDGRYPFFPKTADSIEDTLTHLGELGVLRRSSQSEDGRNRWALVKPLPDGGDGDGRRGGGGGAGANGPEDGGGRGLSEVLAHPILFSVPMDDQEQLIRAALGLKPNGGSGA